MKLSENVSLENQYVRIGDGENASFGGNQMWFSRAHRGKDRRLHDGGCGLVASVDFLLYYCRKNQLHTKDYADFMPVRRGAFREIYEQKEAYLHLLRRMSRFRYPVFPKAGSFAFEVLIFINSFLRKYHRDERMHYLFKNTKKHRMEVIKDSLSRGYPLILIIGQRFLRFWKKDGVNFYRMSNGRLTLAYKDIHRHFVTITGLYFPPQSSMSTYLEITSWGRKYYVDYEELSRYISSISAPFISGIFYLKPSR